MKLLQKYFSLFVDAFKNPCIFASNTTRHASHKNSAPGRVFEFYTGHIQGGRL